MKDNHIQAIKHSQEFATNKQIDTPPDTCLPALSGAFGFYHLVWHGLRGGGNEWQTGVAKAHYAIPTAICSQGH